MDFDINKIRAEFPALERRIYGKPLVYLDNGATTQKPWCVIDFISNYYANNNSNIHRGVHYLSQFSTEAYENARETVRAFINAEKKEEIIFTSGATASINLFAFSFGEAFLKEGDEILVTEMEHHANIVPWQMLCQRKNTKLKVLPILENGELDLSKLEPMLTERVKLVAVAHVSNMLGTVNDINYITELAHKYNIPVMVDGAQAIQHGKVDVRGLGADFYVFSGHKVFAPTGIGVLYGKEEWLEKLPPWQGGGDMVDRVSFENTTYNTLPFKFEAGTTDYVGAMALGVALDYLTGIGIDNIAQYEKQLMEYGTEKLSAIEGIQIYGTSSKKIPVFSFLLKGIHSYDAGMVLDKMGIAVRTGTHCTQPLMQHFGIDGTVRASLVFYNTIGEIDQLADGLLKVSQMFG